MVLLLRHDCRNAAIDSFTGQNSCDKHGDKITSYSMKRWLTIIRCTRTRRLYKKATTILIACHPPQFSPSSTKNPVSHNEWQPQLHVARERFHQVIHCSGWWRYLAKLGVCALFTILSHSNGDRSVARRKIHNVSFGYNLPQTCTPSTRFLLHLDTQIRIHSLTKSRN